MMTSIIDFMKSKPINKGTARLIGFQRNFFKDFQNKSPIDLSQLPDMEVEGFKREAYYGHFRLLLTRVEPTLEGDYMLDVYDLRKENQKGIPENLRARNTYWNPLDALRTYEALRRELPNLN